MIVYKGCVERKIYIQQRFSINNRLLLFSKMVSVCSENDATKTQLVVYVVVIILYWVKL
jgi:uncharacterized Rmd1/YagE family protein